MTTPETTLLHLSLYGGAGPVFIQKLLRVCTHLPDLYGWTVSDWVGLMGATPEKGAQLVTHMRSYQLLHDELAHIERGNAHWMTLIDPHYPHALRAIHAAPPILYYRGSATALNNLQSLAIIGSRDANSYGARIIQSFVPPLVDAGFTIVSGGALGADTMAHRATLDADGITIAVLGSGLLQLYPQRNKRLFEEIIHAGGTVVSPFPMTMQPLPPHFPARNRIIAGLSRGCLVVQAAAKSGTRITANYALQEGRDVFVVPGIFDDPLSTGCHALARDGALLVTSAAEICTELGVSMGAVQTTIPAPTSIPSVKATPHVEPTSLRGRIKAIAQKPISFDELAVQLGLEYDVVQQELWDMQWQGLIQQDFTGRWHC